MHELGPDLLPFFLSSDARWWLASSDPSPLPVSYLIFFFCRSWSREGRWQRAGAAREVMAGQRRPSSPSLLLSYLIFFFAEAEGVRASDGRRYGDACRERRRELFLFLFFWSQIKDVPSYLSQITM
jgi:hypothetical protein